MEEAMTVQFHGKVAIVTGGGSGIGEALCRELGQRDARVIATDINAGDADRVAAMITADGGTATARAADVTSEHDVISLVEDTVSSHGRLDYLFSNAGIAIGGEAHYLTLEHWRRVLDVDLYGVVHGVGGLPRHGAAGIRPPREYVVISGLPPGSRERTLRHSQTCRGGHVPRAADGGRRSRGQDQLRLSWIRAYQHLPELVLGKSARASGRRAGGTGRSARKDDAGREGSGDHPGWVLRNRALIVFPASIRWARRIHDFFPQLIDRELQQQFRRRKKQFATALAASARPGEIAG
jgi:NAD(P)-dependent dehydrogenase (short-subunit alcohol dehydrogenase family)